MSSDDKVYSSEVKKIIVTSKPDDENITIKTPTDLIQDPKDLTTVISMSPTVPVSYNFPILFPKAQIESDIDESITTTSTRDFIQSNNIDHRRNVTAELVLGTVLASAGYNVTTTSISISNTDTSSSTAPVAQTSQTWLLAEGNIIKVFKPNVVNLHPLTSSDITDSLETNLNETHNIKINTVSVEHTISDQSTTEEIQDILKVTVEFADTSTKEKEREYEECKTDLKLCGEKKKSE